MRALDARSLPPVAQEDLRRKGVRAIREGDSPTEVARRFGVSRQAVYNWVARFASGGASALRARKRGRAPARKLLPVQAATIVRLIKDRHPDQLKLPFYLWTREAVQTLIRGKFNVDVSVWTVGRYLKRWGFTPQKPARRAFEQNPEQVQRWLAEEYPAIRAAARREKAEIYWGDELGLRSDHAAGRTYSRRGQTPTLPISGNRFGCNTISALTNRGRLNFMVFRGRFHSKVYLEFLRRLVKQSRRKVFLIVDGHPVHKARVTKKWLAKNVARIRQFLLPAYSPELNPDEYLNQDVKSNAVGRRRPKDADELERNVRGYLRSTQKRPQIVRNYLHAEHVRYAAF